MRAQRHDNISGGLARGDATSSPGSFPRASMRNFLRLRPHHARVEIVVFEDANSVPSTAQSPFGMMSPPYSGHDACSTYMLSSGKR